MENKTRKSLIFPNDLVEEIKIYQHKNMIDTFTEATFTLIRKGLDHDRTKKYN